MTDNWALFSLASSSASDSARCEGSEKSVATSMWRKATLVPDVFCGAFNSATVITASLAAPALPVFPARGCGTCPRASSSNLIFRHGCCRNFRHGGAHAHNRHLRSDPGQCHFFRASRAQPEPLMQRRMLHSHRDLHIGGGCQVEDLPFVKMKKDLGTFGIRALGQHGALLPAVRSKYYAGAARKKVTADTKSGDLHHSSYAERVVKFHSLTGLQSLSGGNGSAS